MQLRAVRHGLRIIEIDARHRAPRPRPLQDLGPPGHVATRGCEDVLHDAPGANAQSSPPADGPPPYSTASGMIRAPRSSISAAIAGWQVKMKTCRSLATRSRIPKARVAAPGVPVDQRLVHEEGEAFAVGVQVADDREAQRQVDLFLRALGERFADLAGRGAGGLPQVEGLVAGIAQFDPVVAPAGDFAEVAAGALEQFGLVLLAEPPVGLPNQPSQQKRAVPAFPAPRAPAASGPGCGPRWCRPSRGPRGARSRSPGGRSFPAAPPRGSCGARAGRAAHRALRAAYSQLLALGLGRRDLGQDSCPAPDGVRSSSRRSSPRAAPVLQPICRNRPAPVGIAVGESGESVPPDRAVPAVAARPPGLGIRPSRPRSARAAAPRPLASFPRLQRRIEQRA